MTSSLWTVVMILFVLWLLGFLFHLAGSFIHILLVVAVILVVLTALPKGKTLF